MDRGQSDYAQSGLHSPVSSSYIAEHYSESSPAVASTTDSHSAAAAGHHYTPQPEVRTSSISASNTPQPEYGLNPPSARSSGFSEYIRHSPYHHAPHSQAGSAPGMAQTTSPSPSNLQPGVQPPSTGEMSSSQHDHYSDRPNDSLVSHTSANNSQSDLDLPIDPSIAAASSPGYPPPYSPYTPQGPHDMSQFQGHQPPPQMYAPREWGGHQYGQQHHQMPGPYGSPATTVSSASPAATAGPRHGQVCFCATTTCSCFICSKSQSTFLVAKS